MKTIQPITSWSNGGQVEAKILNAYVTNDNLSTSASFYYGLLEENDNQELGNVVVSGVLTIFGEDYQNWDAATSANDWAYNWIANQLKLTITGEYVPPVPPEPTPDPVPPTPIITEPNS